MSVQPPRRNRRGAQAVEFALVLPVLMLFASAISDFSQFLYVRDALVAAVAAGARAGATVNMYETADPITVAQSTAATSFTASAAGGTPTFVATYSGAAPDRALVLTGTVGVVPWFGLIAALPASTSYTATLRTLRQN